MGVAGFRTGESHGGWAGRVGVSPCILSSRPAMMMGGFFSLRVSRDGPVVFTAWDLGAFCPVSTGECISWSSIVGR